MDLYSYQRSNESYRDKRGQCIHNAAFDLIEGRNKRIVSYFTEFRRVYNGYSKLNWSNSLFYTNEAYGQKVNFRYGIWVLVSTPICDWLSISQRMEHGYVYCYLHLHLHFLDISCRLYLVLHCRGHP